VTTPPFPAGIFADGGFPFTNKHFCDLILGNTETCFYGKRMKRQKIGVAG
jgi:hypothetical protein